MKLQLAIELDVKPKSLEERLRSEVTHKNVKKVVTTDEKEIELDFEDLIDQQARGEQYVFGRDPDWQNEKLRLRNISENSDVLILTGQIFW